MSTSNQAQALTVAQTMRQVLYALIPGTLLLIYLFGWGMLSNLLISVLCAYALEALMLILRQRPLVLFLNDYSVWVTAWLLAISLPAFAPWWLIAIGMVFAVVIAKHLYGGLGHNPFNPAMVAYAALLISFPLEMTRWPDPTHSSFAEIDLPTTFALITSSVTIEFWDAFSAATSLDIQKQGMEIPAASLNPFLSQGGVNLLYLAGGCWLLKKGVISWHIPGAFIITLVAFSGLFWLWDSARYASPLFHLLHGACFLGAFFIATDPVSASTTRWGKLFYAAGIGMLVFLIRSLGGYPDGVAFAVIIMNMAVPLIDYYTKPRVYGYSNRHNTD